MTASEAISRNGSDAATLIAFVVRSWDLMINETNSQSDGYFLGEISRHNFSLPSSEAFSWFFEFCTHLADIAEQLNKSNADEPTAGPLESGSASTSSARSEVLPPGVKAVFVFLVLVTSFASVLGNALSVWVTIKIRSTRTTSCFIICLAVSDLLQTFTICASETANILNDWHWIYGGFLCKAIPFVQSASSLINALTLSLIAIGRYLAVTDTMRWRTLQLDKISTLALLFIWSFSTLISLPIAFLFEYGTSHDDARALPLMTRDEQLGAARVDSAERDFMSPASSDSSSWDESRQNFCWWNSSNEAAKKIYFYVVPACMFLPLFLVITVMYSYMARFLWRRQPIGEMGQSRASSLTRSRCDQAKRGRIVKLLALLILVFLCCRGPVQVFNVLQFINKYKLTFPVLVIRNILITVKLINCCLNPLLYCLLHDRFKRYLLSLLAACRVSFGQTSSYTKPTEHHEPSSSSNAGRAAADLGAPIDGSRAVLSSAPRKKSVVVSLPLALFKAASRGHRRPSRVELSSWQGTTADTGAGQSLTLERLIQSEHHSV